MGSRVSELVFEGSFVKKKIYLELEFVENGGVRWKRNLRRVIVYRVLYVYIENVIIFFIYV